MEDKVGLISLPNELQEKIIEYLIQFNKKLLYRDVVSYSMTNKTIMDVCDNFFRRRAQLENIPLELFTERNCLNIYHELEDDLHYVRKFDFVWQNTCVQRAILRGDLERVKWLTSLSLMDCKLIGELTKEKIHIHLGSSYYAFTNDKDIICRWLIKNLCKYGLGLHVKNTYIPTFFNQIVDYALYKNKVDILDYLLNEILPLISMVKTSIFYGFAMINDIDKIDGLLNNHVFTKDEYKEIIRKISLVSDMKTIYYLIHHYPGDKDDLDYLVYGSKQSK